MTHRNFLGTCYAKEALEFPQEFLEKLSQKAVYVNGQLEKCPTTDRVHLQFYCRFKQTYRIAGVSKIAKAHWTPVKFDNGADRYCLKEETRIDGPWEYGVKPMRRNEATDWENVWKQAQKGDIEQIPADVRIRCYSGLKRIEKDHMSVPPRDAPKVCEWFWGEPGTGKTRAACEGPHYKKLANKWWDGYQGQETVVIDDIGVEKAKALVDHLKLWADPWQNQPGETKGGMVPLKYNRLIVTSNYPLESVAGDVDLAALQRRFKVTRF